MAKKSEKKSRRLYKREEAHILTDMMIMFVGVCILVLAFLSLSGVVPEEYAFGATLAGLFFVISDVLIVEEEITGITLILYALSLFVGLASFILLPVILLNSASLRTLMSDSDFYTFLALGFVLILMGYKTFMRKIKEKEKDTMKINEIKAELLKLAEKHEESSELIEKIKSDLDRAHFQYTEAINDNK